jgi:hypothetical protein
LLYESAQFGAGFGSALTFGITDIANGWAGNSSVIDQCSASYAAGTYTELGLELGLTGASFALRGAAKGLTQNAVRRGLSSSIVRGTRGVSAVHHINPLKAGLFPTGALPTFIRHHRWNLKLLSLPQHTAAHRRLVALERGVSTAFNPAMTTGRVARAAYVGNGCE